MITDGFAIYRMPHEKACAVVSGTISPLRPDLGARGFVIAPFGHGDTTPRLLIGGEGRVLAADSDSVPCSIREQIDSCCSRNVGSGDTVASGRSAYSDDFSRFHSQLESGRFDKLVLSRRSAIHTPCRPFELFARACERYPRMFITLFSTPQSGTWLMATPELLLEGKGDRWHTMALAGTMRLEGDALRFDDPVGTRLSMMWSEKNIQEQRYVATYTCAVLRRFANDVREEGPRTVRAGRLVHLRSDFSFTMPPGDAGRLIEALHPTPAVCGLPKDEALRFITANEHCPRLYYSGFAGPVGFDDATSLFVSLRCMQICGSCCLLYAGGGLLTDSDEQSEWEETEAKMDTMREICTATKRI